MPPLPWIFLDAGNTLVHIDFEFLARTLVEHGIPAAVDALRQAEYRARAEVDTPELVPHSTDRDRWEIYFGFIMNAVGATEPGLVRRLHAAFRRRQTERNLWRIPDPDAPAVLGALRSAGHRLACISNSDGSVRRVLREGGLEGFLEFVVDSTEVGFEKPDPRIFREALARADVLPAESAYVGDVFHVDVVGARAAGMTPIFLDPVGRLPREPVARIRSLAELPACVEALRSGFSGPSTP